MDLPTIQPSSLEEVRGGLVRSRSSSTTNAMMMQMQMISDSIRNAALQQQNQGMSPMMVAMLGMALMNRA